MCLVWGSFSFLFSLSYLILNSSYFDKPNFLFSFDYIKIHSRAQFKNSSVLCITVTSQQAVERCFMLMGIDWTTLATLWGPWALLTRLGYHCSRWAVILAAELGRIAVAELTAIQRQVLLHLWEF